MKLTTLALTLSLAAYLVGFGGKARADSMDSAISLESLVSFVEKQQMGEDGQTPLDKDQLKIVQKHLRDKVEACLRVNAAELAQWKEDSKNPPQNMTAEQTQLWGEQMKKRKQRIDDAKLLLDALDKRIKALPDLKPKAKDPRRKG